MMEQIYSRLPARGIARIFQRRGGGGGGGGGVTLSLTPRVLTWSTAEGWSCKWSIDSCIFAT